MKGKNIYNCSLALALWILSHTLQIHIWCDMISFMKCWIMFLSPICQWISLELYWLEAFFSTIFFRWQIRVIDRNCEIPHEGPFCDLMWSDPEDIETWAVSPRGAGWLFGSRVTSEVILYVLKFNHTTSYGAYADFNYCSSITLITLIWFAEHINLYKKVSSICFRIKALWL